MKMTDDLADQLRNKLRNIISGYRINEDDAGWLEGLMAARLAADQQKGGGEVAEYQSQVTDKATGAIVHPWSHCGRAAYDAAKGQPHEGSRLRVEYRKLYATPKPSIPAPAQQVESMRDLAKQWRRDAESCRRDGYTDAAAVKEDCAFALSQLLGMSPAQQDGKASGGDWCPSCKGSGEIEGYVQPPMQSPEDSYIAAIECQECNGTGSALAHPPHADQETQS